MIAYKKEPLDNLSIHDQLENVFSKQCISKEELKTCEEKYPVNFYTPNIFVRIGLFILTCVIAIFSFGLLSLMSLSSGGEDGFIIMLTLFALISYGALEFMVHSKNHYKSGVDDALMWMSGIFIVVAFNFKGSLSYLENSMLIFVICSFFTLRFVNMIMGAIATSALFVMIFLAYINFGDFAKTTAPFLLMAVALLVYFLSSKKSETKYYKKCLLMTEIVSLACIYIFANYFVIRMLTDSLLYPIQEESHPITLGWLLWIFTAIIPFTYIARGIQKKDVVLIRMGLIFIAALVFTVRAFYHVMPAETAMIIGGLIMIAIAYTLIKYLKEPKYGFTDEEPNEANSFARKQIESMIIAETFGQAKTETQAGNATEFGGGSGGGGGAGGDF